MAQKPKAKHYQPRRGPLDAYAEAVRREGAESIHSLLIRSGPRVLARGIPYLVIAARFRRGEAARTERRRRDLLERHGDDVSPPTPPSMWDPYDLVSANEELRRVADALAELPDEDTLVLWRHAQGVTDEEIAREWDELGFTPTTPTAELIRKRRERARERLRERLTADRSRSP